LTKSEIMLSRLCRFIYTGSVQVTNEIAQDLLRAADQYLLEGLKRLCEYTIAKVIRKPTHWLFSPLIRSKLNIFYLAGCESR
jgi:hypothetical protein